MKKLTNTSFHRLALLMAIFLSLSAKGKINAASFDDDDTRTDFHQKVLASQDENTVTLFGGLGLVAQSKNSFADRHPSTSIFFGTAAFHHYFSNPIALGLQYTFVGSHSGRDLLRGHFVAPSVTGRLLMDNGHQAVTFGLAPGYMHYGDKLRNDEGRRLVFRKGYFAVDFNLGYDIALTRRLAFGLRMDVLTAAWKQNPEYRLFSNDKYRYFYDANGNRWVSDNHETMFIPSLTYISLSVGLGYRF